MRELIKEYRNKVEGVSKTCETLEEECNYLHEIFNELFYTLEVISGEIEPLQFLRKEVTRILDDSESIKVLQISLYEFKIVIGADVLIDESKTQNYIIEGVKFTVMESFDRAQRWLHTIKEQQLSEILDNYKSKNGGNLWN